MDDDLYVWRLEQTGIELTPAAIEHDREELGADSVRAFEVGGIHLELLLFDRQDAHQDVIRMVEEEGWGGDGYWLAASSGGALLLIRSGPEATDAERASVDALVAAFAGEE